MSTDQSEYTVWYSILDYPERMAATGLSEDEIKSLLDRYSQIDDFDFTFAGRVKAR